MRISVFASCLLLAAACTSSGDDAADDTGDDDTTAHECTPQDDTCTGDNICVQFNCESAFNRIYDISSITVNLPTTDPSGAAWDIGGGAPDIFVEGRNGTQSIGTTATVDDAFSASFSDSLSATLVSGVELWLDVYDEDVSANDLAFSCGGALTADLLRGRGLMCDDGASMVTFNIFPRP